MKTIREMQNDYYNAGYGTSGLSFEQYVKRQMPSQPKSYSEYKRVEDNYYYGGYGTSGMSFEDYLNNLEE
jgi:hypothetical protein